MRIPYRKPGKFSQLATDPILTGHKFAELKNKLDRLKNVVRPEAAAEVSRLAELGDFSENAEYQLAKGRLRGINNTILKLEHQLNQAVVITPGSGDVVETGSTVTLERDGKEKKYQILGSTETSPEKGIISHTSPLGEALMGHRVGETVEVRLTNNVAKYTLLKIE